MADRTASREGVERMSDAPPCVFKGCDVKIHILRPESITPITLYIDRQQKNPESYQVQLEFAAVLLYREREYRGMNSSKWFAGEKAAPSDNSPFQPFDITTDAAANLAGILANGASAAMLNYADDLFGLKDAAIDGLRRVLRPVKSHRLGWLLNASLLIDMCRYHEAVPAADQAYALGERTHGSALASHAALLGAIPREGIERHRELNRAIDAFTERVRRLAVRVRTQVEGDAFTRFLSTELAFCEKEREAALESFDESRIPPALHALIPLARQIGVGDDGCRAVFVARMRARERREAARMIRERGDEIDGWLSSVGAPPYRGEAEAFFWLRAAADELDS
jgi:hypothetical protein